MLQIITPKLSDAINPSPYFPVETISPAQWRNGAIVRMPNHLGDAMMALPALTQLKQIIPAGCGLFVIAPEGMRQIYAALPMVNAMIGLGALHRFWTLAEIRKIRQLRPGIAILFNHSLRDVVSLRVAGIKHLFGAAARGRSTMLTRSFSFPPHQRKLHLAQEPLAKRYSAIVEALGAPPWDGAPVAFKPLYLMDEMRTHISALCGHPRLLLIAAGAAYGAAKRWPSDRFNLIARHWVKSGGIVAALGSESESGIGCEVLAGISGCKSINLCGKTGLDELIPLMKHAKMVVSNDSGLMHLAAMLGAPGVAVFGPTDPTATAPLSEKWRLVCRRQECAPCFKRVCPFQDPKCMKTISPLPVLRAMRELGM